MRSAQAGRCDTSQGVIIIENTAPAKNAWS
jgi:hypothetical protein